MKRWNLHDLKHAYSEWLRVLGKGGVLLNFDCNCYLHKTDLVFEEKYKEDRRRTQSKRIEDTWDDEQYE